MVERTKKAEATRQRIIETTLQLIAERGYEHTTMRDIAKEADCSLGLAYRYFVNKEDIVLELYHQFSRKLAHVVDELPQTTLADRFQQAMLTLLDLMAPYRATLGAIFGAALNPRSKVGVFGRDVRDDTRKVYITIVAEAKDAPRAVQANELATVLYGVQLALVLFWLQDLSEGSKKTYELLAFVHDMFTLLRPLLGLPPVSQALSRLVHIIGPMLGDDSL